MGVLNEWARKCFEYAIRRGKTRIGVNHEELVRGIGEEFVELCMADRDIKSKHVAWLTEEQEEMVDLMICCMTELWNQGVNIDDSLKAKIELNRIRAERCRRETL